MNNRRRAMIALLLSAGTLLSILPGCGAKTEDSEKALTASEAYHIAANAVEEEPEQLYSVVSPMGVNNVEQIEMAPRLDTLAGKRIALVGGSFHAAETHGELKRMILQDYPDATVYMFDEVGSAGTYNLFSVSNQVKQFQTALKNLRIDAVVTGNCG